jgi:hypothetical protein
MIKASAARLKFEEFVVLYPVPSLHLEAVDIDDALYQPGEELEAVTARERSFRRTTTHSGDAERYGDRFAFLMKRPGNALPNMIAVGRAPNNDIVIDLFSISKVHGYFLREGDAWSYTDHGSTNGTTWNSKPVKANEKCRLSDDDRIGFGEELVARFRTPRALHTWARGAS